MEEIVDLRKISSNKWKRDMVFARTFESNFKNNREL